MTTYGRHHPEIRLTIPPCRKPIPYRDTPRTPTRRGSTLMSTVSIDPLENLPGEGCLSATLTA